MWDLLLIGGVGFLWLVALSVHILIVLHAVFIIELFDINCPLEKASLLKTTIPIRTIIQRHSIHYYSFWSVVPYAFLTVGHCTRGWKLHCVVALSHIQVKRIHIVCTYVLTLSLFLMFLDL